MRTIEYPIDIAKEFQLSFAQNQDRLDIIDWQVNEEILKTLYNIEGKTAQTRRAQVQDPVIRSKIRNILTDLGIDKQKGEGWMCYSRAFLPTALHVDIPEDDVNENGHTIIIPLTPSDKIKTLVFKEECNSPILDYWIEKQDWDNREKISEISAKHDMSHGWWKRPDIVDHMELDGIGEWKVGTAFCFKRSQIHGSTNFTHAGFPFKDYLLVQTNN